MRFVKQEETTTPNPWPDGYDWRKETWLDESQTTDLEQTVALIIAAAMNADPEQANPTPLQTEDAQVFALLRPDLMECAVKGPAAPEIARYRLAAAIAQCLSMCRRQWIEKYGSADAPGRTPSDA